LETPIDDSTHALNGVPPAEIKTQLERVLGSHMFVNSRRIRRFLQFVVEERLRGQQHRLKEYLIGLNVFDRTEAFDPRVDSIVRVEARRLRAKLEGYYLTEGRDDILRIVLPKGSYVPLIEDRRAPANGSAAAARTHRRSIAFTPFTVANAPGDALGLVDEIKRRLTHVLIKEGNFQVMAQPQSAAAAAGDLAWDAGHSTGTPDRTLSLREASNIMATGCT
jgi:hypothetical protein